MRRSVWPALLLAVVLWQAPGSVLAQQGELRHVVAHFDSNAEELYLGRHDAKAAIPPDLLSANGLRSMGASAFPLVRRYIWLSSYVDDDLFAGYSQPLSIDQDEIGEGMAFQLLIDRSTWAAFNPAARQKKLYEAQARFNDRLSELNLEGTLHIVLTSQ